MVLMILPMPNFYCTTQSASLAANSQDLVNDLESFYRQSFINFTWKPETNVMISFLNLDPHHTWLRMYKSISQTSYYAWFSVMILWVVKKSKRLSFYWRTNFDMIVSYDTSIPKREIKLERLNHTHISTIYELSSLILAFGNSFIEIMPYLCVWLHF